MMVSQVMNDASNFFVFCFVFIDIFPFQFKAQSLAHRIVHSTLPLQSKLLTIIQEWKLLQIDIITFIHIDNGRMAMHNVALWDNLEKLEFLVVVQIFRHGFFFTIKTNTQKKQTHKKTNKQIHKHTNTQKHKQTQTNKQTNTQTHKQTQTHTNKHKQTQLHLLLFVCLFCIHCSLFCDEVGGCKCCELVFLLWVYQTRSTTTTIALSEHSHAQSNTLL